MSSRIIVARFNIAVIQGYAPISDSTEEEIEMFNWQLEHIIEEFPKKDL